MTHVRVILAVLLAIGSGVYMPFASGQTATSSDTVPSDDLVNVKANGKRELFAARYENAARLFASVVSRRPEDGDAWYGLVRAQLGLHRSRDAYDSAAQAIQQAPGSAGAQTAAGLAAFRRGDLAQAESAFRAALKINGQYPGALAGMASIYSAISKFKTARDLRLHAYRFSPDDPALMIAYASTLKGDAHISGLMAALARLDPRSEEAAGLRAHIADERALAGRNLTRLVSPYRTTTVKLFRIMDGPGRPRGLGVAVRLNGKETAHLLVDTGASGISISPKLAEKAGLERVTGEAWQTKGIGDEKPQSSIAYIAPELRIGDVVFADCPVYAFPNARNANHDGIIGPDVLGLFIVHLDFVQEVMSLEARPKMPDPDSDPIDWTTTPPPGFYRVLRFGHNLAVPTFINGGDSALFLVDSGATFNLIDTETARKHTAVDKDSRLVVKGIQGKVKETSLAARISLQFAGFRQDNTDLLAISLEKMSDEVGVGFGGILGMPVLGQLSLTIDYLEGTIRFEYKKP